LEETNYGWILDSYPFDEIKGGFVDEAYSSGKFNPEDMEQVEIPLIIIVHGRLYIEPAKAYVENGEYYIGHEEFESHF